ncbi:MULTISPECIES: PadR family transcriptional regulator [Streptomyces]|uniref:PadR family transcriptional regulator n=1 Tax=Streptomyces lycii TaxID=2654337 RepID=A0ABQ7FPN4_9ACTN|nr:MULTISPECIES: PadR family transcriptional regulator [Streptomyces]KAF4410330.1 PadR family transcriptional regulator [Streptomyces lycii]PGH49746.1 transcriptional regulator [Streptomyces sp. Ru87]
MSATRLLVLGAVRQHGRAHGYQVRNDLEFWGAHEWSNAKPGSIYHALKQMAKQGLLIEHDTAPSTAGGPPRTEYELTDEGEREFFSLLREALLRHDEKPDMLTAGVGFIVDLPRAEAVSLLKQRVAALEAWREEVGRHWTPPAAPEEWGHIGEIMKLWTHEAESSAAWTRGLIERLEAGAYVMAGEGERSLDVLPPGAVNPYADRAARESGNSGGGPGENPGGDPGGPGGG